MNIEDIVVKLQNHHVVAYPTEAVFGLGCDPLNENAVNKLLMLKQRPLTKGLILVAPSLDYFDDFVNLKKLNQEQLDRLKRQYDHPITWVVPAKADVPIWITGQFSSLAIRLCQHPAVTLLCKKTNFALTSTSANLSGLTPCKTADEVRRQFGRDFPTLDMPVGNAKNPSEIIDLCTGKQIRQG